MNHKKKNILLIMVLSIIMQIIAVTNIEVFRIDAKGNDQIVHKLEFINPQEVYDVNQTIQLKGEFKLPNDELDKEYKAGDTFQVKLPEGLEPVDKDRPILIGDLGEGKYDASTHSYIFEFNENINDRANRKGGFKLRLQAVGVDEGDEVELPVDFKDENGTTILKDMITISNPKYEGNVGNQTQTPLSKAFSSEENIWYLYINEDGSYEGDTFILADRADQYQIINFETMHLDQLVYQGENQRGEDVASTHPSSSSIKKININDFLTIDEDKKGFQLNLPLTNEAGGRYTYYLEYEVDLDFNHVDITLDDLKVHNSVEVITDTNQYITIPGNGSVPDGTAEGTWSLDGWGEASNPTYGTFRIRKIDAITKEPVPGVKFRLEHYFDKNLVYDFDKTDDEGISTQRIPSGLYNLIELEVPNGYSKIKDKVVEIKYQSTDDIKEVVVENHREPLELQMQKVWENEFGNELDLNERKDIVVQVWKDAPQEELVFQKVIEAEDTDKIHTFKNLEPIDEHGNEIKYFIKELQVGGFEAPEYRVEDQLTIITNKKLPKHLPNEKININGIKIWQDKNGDVIESQEDIEIKLYANNVLVDSKILKKGETEFSFGNLDKYNDGQEVIYQIDEVKLDGYITTIDQEDLENVKIVNSQIPIVPLPSPLLEIKGIKEWYDFNGQTIKPQEDIEIELYADSVLIDTAKILKNDKQEFKFQALAKYDQDGKEIKYEVKEKDLKGYVSIIDSKDLSDIKIMNTQESINILGKKIWKNESGNIIEPQADIIIDLYADGERIKSVELSKEENTFAFENLPKYRDGKLIDYYVREELEGYKTDVYYNTQTNLWEITNTKIKSIIPKEPKPDNKEEPQTEEIKKDPITAEQSQTIEQSRPAKQSTIPNTGISMTYAPYILVILLSIITLLIRSLVKLKKINK